MREPSSTSLAFDAVGFGHTGKVLAAAVAVAVVGCTRMRFAVAVVVVVVGRTGMQLAAAAIVVVVGLTGMQLAAYVVVVLVGRTGVRLAAQHHLTREPCRSPIQFRGYTHLSRTRYLNAPYLCNSKPSARGRPVSCGQEDRAWSRRGTARRG